MESKSVFEEMNFRKSKYNHTIRKSLRVPVGTYYDHTHYLIDQNTAEAVQMAFIKYCETDNKEEFEINIQYLKTLYGTDFLKQLQFKND